MKNPIIETERLLLREYTLNDFDALYEIMSDPETMQHYPAPFDKARTRRWIEWNLENYAQYGFGLWAVVLKKTGEFIGDCGITIQNIDGEMLPEIGYHIQKKHWRKGFAKEAARAVRDWVFRNTDYDTVFSYMKYTNVGSWSTAIANGMKKIKEYPDPKNMVSYAFAITREEWEKLQESQDQMDQVRRRFPGISCAYRDAAGNETVEYYGAADLENSILVDSNTIFPACSISKFITAICVMEMRDQKLVDINLPVNKYLHKWKLLRTDNTESDATIRSLLCHTAGIVEGEDSFYGLRRNDPEIRLMDILEGRTTYNNRPARTEKPQGMAFEYSDAGYCVLQQLLEEIAHQPFEEIARELVFDRLKLKHTFFASPGNIAYYESHATMATGYDENWASVPGRFPQVPDLAASGLWSTPKELLLIAKEFIAAWDDRSSFLCRESAREMGKPVERFPWTGLGVFTGETDTLVSKGWGENGQCLLQMNCRTGEIAVVMTNRNPGVDQKESGIEWLAGRHLT